MAIGNKPIEDYVPVVSQNQGIYSTYPIEVSGLSYTSLTLSGTLAVTGVSTLGVVNATSVTASGALVGASVGISGAVVAKGATTAATLGDIGLTGPATAAQNAWFPVQAGATTYFVPVWL